MATWYLKLREPYFYDHDICFQKGYISVKNGPKLKTIIAVVWNGPEGSEGPEGSKCQNNLEGQDGPRNLEGQ